MSNLSDSLNKNKKMIEEAIKLDLKEWDYKNSFEEMLEISENAQEIESSKKITNLKNVAIIGKIDPKVLINIISKLSKLEIKVTFYLKEKLLATNKAILETLEAKDLTTKFSDKNKENSKLNLKNSKKENNFNYVQIKSIDEFYNFQENYEACIYLGNKKEYLSFTKRLKILNFYQNYGEIYVYLENNDFKNEIINFEKYAYENDIEIKYYLADLEKTIKEINTVGPVNIFGIYAKKTENALHLANEVLAENIFVNVNLIEKYKFDFDADKLFFKKKVIYK